MKLRAFAAVAALAGLSFAPRPALANGRFPSAGQIAVDPSDPKHIVVRATYGVISTRDAGQRWSWICESAVGYGGFEDPMMAITKDGTLLAGIFEGLSVSHDGGCAWGFEKGGLTERYVIDLATEKQDPSKAVLIVSNSTGAGAFLTQLWESSDDAKTWTQAGVDLPTEFLGLAVDAAPSDPNRIYVSGRVGSPDYAGVLQRSKDRGKTWEKLAIPGSDDTNLPYIGGIDPNNPDVLYVRLDGDMSDKLLVSKDGGESWSEAFVASSNLLGFAISPDGATIALGGTADGLWTGAASDLQFKKVATVGVKCLTWTDAGLYACADEFTDKFTAGLSTNGGATFTPIMHLQDLCGPLDCAADSTTGKLCPPLWGATKTTIGGSTCDGSDAGTTGGGATSSASSTGGGGGGGDASDGCSCGVPARSRTSGALALVLVGAAALVRRRAARARTR